MENFFKQFVYTGVGLVALSAEKAKKLVDRLIEEGKLSAEEGKKIVDEFTANTDTKKEELETQFNSVVEKIVKSFKFATNQDLAELTNRVTVLEAVLANKKDAEDAADKGDKKAPKTKKVTKTENPKETEE
jgi:polyhydroxyalkanoate synthesis regulator phasin